MVQEGGRQCKKSTLNDLVHLTHLRIPLITPPSVGIHPIPHKLGRKYLMTEQESGDLQSYVLYTVVCDLKVHKRENFLGFDFEICTFSLLVMPKCSGFALKKMLLDHYWGR